MIEVVMCTKTGNDNLMGTETGNDNLMGTKTGNADSIEKHDEVSNPIITVEDDNNEEEEDPTGSRGK
ncbi:hypothetical protein A2U01_0096766, partial [Trifolium medium]|nr:hypothetical protein [Trifolium medium]